MHPLTRSIDFHPGDDPRYPYQASVDGQLWQVRVNEFPAHPAIYSLLVDGQELVDVPQWPACWRRPGMEVDPSGPRQQPPRTETRSTAEDRHLQGDCEQESRRDEHQRGIGPSQLVRPEPFQVDALFARVEAQSRADLAAAEREARVIGKEQFSYARLTKLFGRTPPDFEAILRQDYYVCHPELMTLAEYAAHLRLMDLWDS